MPLSFCVEKEEEKTLVSRSDVYSMDRSSRRPAPYSAATTTWVKEMHHLHLSKTQWCLQFLPPSSRYQSWKLSLSLSLADAKEMGARIHELLTCFRDGYYFVSFWALDAYLLKKNAEAHHSLPLGGGGVWDHDLIAELCRQSCETAGWRRRIWHSELHASNLVSCKHW